MRVERLWDAQYYTLDPNLQYPPANLADRQRLCVVVSHPARAQCRAASGVWHRVQDCLTDLQDNLKLAVAVWLEDDKEMGLWPAIEPERRCSMTTREEHNQTVCHHRYKLVGYRDRRQNQAMTAESFVPMDAVLACMRCAGEKLIPMTRLPPAPIIQTGPRR